MRLCLINSKDSIFIKLLDPPETISFISSLGVTVKIKRGSRSFYIGADDSLFIGNIDNTFIYHHNGYVNPRHKKTIVKILVSLAELLEVVNENLR